MVTERTRTVEATLFDVIYAAGLFEGEGHIGIRAHRPRGFLSYVLEVVVRMCDREPVERLQAHWGGNIRVSQPSGEAVDRVRPAFMWVLSSRQAARFLRDIRPYLASVRLQTKADLALAFQGQKSNTVKNVDLAEYRDRQQEFFEAMRGLNTRGVEALTSEERLQVLAEVV